MKTGAERAERSEASEAADICDAQSQRHDAKQQLVGTARCERTGQSYLYRTIADSHNNFGRGTAPQNYAAEIGYLQGPLPSKVLFVCASN